MPCPVRMRFRAVHCALFSSKSGTLLSGALTGDWFRTLVFVHMFAYISSIVLFDRVRLHIGFLDLSLLGGWFTISICTGESGWLLNFNNIDSVWTCLRRSGGAMLDRTGNQSNWVDLTVPFMILMVSFSCTSTFLQCILLAHTGAQYSATLYTRARAEVRSTFAW